MSRYGPGAQSWSYDEMPEDKTWLELRPSLEKGEDSHVRDCLVWHTTSPRQRLNSLNRQYPGGGGGGRTMHWTPRGSDWSDSACGQPNCRSCGGVDHLTERDVGYVRRNELGRTVDRGFTSKPDQLKTPDELASSRYTYRGYGRYEPPNDGKGFRDPFNRPVNDPYQSKTGWRHTLPDNDWKKQQYCGSGGKCDTGNCGGKKSRHDYDGDSWNNAPPQSYGRNEMEQYAPRQPMYNGGAGGGYNGPSNGGGGGTYRPELNNELNNYRQTFPRIDEKDRGSVSYRGPPPDQRQSYGDGGADFQPPASYRGGGGGGPAAASSGYPDNYDDMPVGAADRRATMGGGGGGGTARGNDMPFPRKDAPGQSSMKSGGGSQRKLKGQNEPVRFDVGF